MGAKFKAPLDSRCFADMEEQHFCLPLPPCVYLSSALLSFNSLASSISLSLPPAFYFSSALLSQKTSDFIYRRPLLLSFFFGRLFRQLLPCLLLLFLFSIFDSTVHLLLCGPLVLPFSLFVSQSSFHHICQSFKSDRHWSVLCSGDAVLVQVCSESFHLTLDPNRALKSELSKDNRWSKTDSCSALPCRYLPGSKTLPVSPSFSPLASSPRSPSPAPHHPLLFRRWHFHKCLTPAICSLRGLQSLPLM